MSNFSTAQLSSWGESDIHALSSADLAAMEPSQFRAFAAKQLALLKPQKIMQLGAKQLKALPADILQKLTPAMIGMFPDSFLHNLDEVQLASMSADQIGSMTSEQLESYNARQLARLDPAHLCAMESWSRGRDAAVAVYPAPGARLHRLKRTRHPRAGRERNGDFFHFGASHGAAVDFFDLGASLDPTHRAAPWAANIDRFPADPFPRTQTQNPASWTLHPEP
jgi:hypothetical protein